MPVKSYIEIVITLSVPTPKATDLTKVAREAENDLRTKVRLATKAKVADIRSRHNIRIWMQDD